VKKERRGGTAKKRHRYGKGFVGEGERGTRKENVEKGCAWVNSKKRMEKQWREEKT